MSGDLVLRGNFCFHGGEKGVSVSQNGKGVLGLGWTLSFGWDGGALKGEAYINI